MLLIVGMSVVGRKAKTIVLFLGDAAFTVRSFFLPSIVIVGANLFTCD